MNKNQGASNSENQGNVRADVWTGFDQDQRQLFNRIFEQERQRKNELVQQLDPDCRSAVSEHFDNILSTIVSDVIQNTQLSMA